MFNIGQKLRNKNNGDVLTCMSEVSRDNRIGLGSENSIYYSIHIDDVEPYHDNKPIPVDERLPTESDADKNGIIIICNSDGTRRRAKWNWHVKDDSIDMTLSWCRTPLWQPREPLLEGVDPCNMCDHDRRKYEGEDCVAQYCAKHDNWDTQPFYTDDDRPCHLGD